MVHLAKRKEDGRCYALKQISMRDFKRSEREEAIDEARVLASLNSPHVIRYHDCFIEEDQLNIVMEYAAGGTAYDLIARTYRTGMPEALVWRFFLQCLKGLQYMHGRRIIHRDIKTLNVFIDAEGNAKIGDLGIARTLSEQTRFIRTVVGTPFYLSPELCEDKPYNEKSDIWALGVCLYEFCTGRHPFEAQNEGALIRKIMKGVFQPVEGYSRELCEVSRMCLTLNPDHRPDSNRLLGLPGVRAKVRELRIDMVDRADAAKVQQDYGASRQLRGEGDRHASRGPSHKSSRDDSSARAKSSQTAASLPRGALGPTPSASASASMRPSSRGGAAAGRSAGSSQRAAGAPFDILSSGTDPFLAYEMQKARIDDGVTAQVQEDMAAQKQAIARAMKQDNIGALMGNPHTYSAGRQSRPQSSHGSELSRKAPENMPAAGAARRQDEEALPLGKGSFRGSRNSANYQTAAQEQAANAAATATYEAPRYGRRRCHDIMITGPSMRAPTPKSGGGQRGQAFLRPISGTDSSSTAMFTSSYMP